jgi:hypothetical protein
MLTLDELNPRKTLHTYGDNTSLKKKKTTLKEKIFTCKSKSGILFCLDLHETQSYQGSHSQNH